MRTQSMLSSVLLATTALFHVHAAPVASEEARLESRATINPATGVTGNGVQTRMELRTMQQQHPNMFNVYLLGLQDMYAVAQTDPLSFYQIAGIHGRPYLPYNGVGTAPGDGGGYCTHTSNLFLPWHRPYLALFEQTLYTHVQKVAKEFSSSNGDQAKYVAAAENFRIPYWDWAAPPPTNGHAYPLLVSTQYVSVYTPSGQQTILNPLFRYDFKYASSAAEASDMVYSPFSEWTVTKRDPTAWNASGVSQNNLVATQIENGRVSFADRLYTLFTTYSNFTQFGNEAWITSSTTNADSLESLHDTIHAITGSNGHMSYLDYAAFDPIFFLHHAMIDRAFAMWTAVYPNSYVEGMNAVGGTFSYPAGTYEDVNSALPPFYNTTSGTTSWQSSTVKSTTTFGYNYPETVSGQTVADIKAAINTLYGTTAGSSTVSSKKRSVVDDVAYAAQAQHDATQNSNSYQYIVNAVSQKFAMNGSYAIYFFLGNYSDSPSEWSTDPNLVGTHAVFASLGSSTALQKRAMNMDLKVTGSVPLTTMLVNLVATGSLKSLSPSDVSPYLTANLHWRVAMMDGTEIQAADVPDLSVSVVTAEVQPAASESEFPTWGQFTSLANVTAGQAGGHSSKYWKAPAKLAKSQAEHIYNGIKHRSYD